MAWMPRCTPRFVQHEVVQRGLEAFDPGGQDCLFTDVAVDEDVGVGQQFGDRVEAAECSGGLFEEASEALPGTDSRGRWEGSGYEGTYGLTAGGGRFVGACGFASHGMAGRGGEKPAVGIPRWRSGTKGSMALLCLVSRLGRKSC